MAKSFDFYHVRNSKLLLDKIEFSKQAVYIVHLVKNVQWNYATACVALVLSMINDKSGAHITVRSTLYMFET